jgi:drug/metabolite transporter (DMT)-like permease
MIALLGGLGAAGMWAIGALCASAASRSIGAASTLAWVMGIGLLVLVVPVLLSAPLSQLTPRTLGLIAVAGGTNVAGLRIEYTAFRRGKVGVVTAIASTEGVIAATIAVVAGAPLAVWTALVLVAVASGVVLAAMRPDPVADSATGVRSAVLAIPVALLFGVSLYATGHVGMQISVLWVLLPARLAGFVAITVPMALRHSLRLTRRALPLVTASALCEVLGIVSYILGARHNLAIAAVIASQFAALTALGALWVFRERLTRLQLAGLGVIAVGVAALAAGQA